MSWGQELWDRVDAVIGQLTEDTDELAGLFTRWVIGVGDGDIRDIGDQNYSGH